MLTDLFSASRINEIIAESDGLDAEGKKGLALRTKHLAAKGYLLPVEDPNAKATSAKLYPATELARTAVLTDVVSAGFEGDALQTVAIALNAPPKMDFGHAPSANVGGAFRYDHGGLVSAVRGMLSDDPGTWRLDFSCGIESGKRPTWIAHVVYLPSESPEPESYLALLRRPIVRGTFDLTERLKPLLPLLKPVLEGK